LNRDREYSALKEMLDLKRTDAVLDVGCGDGFWTSRLAPFSGHVTGLDPDGASLDNARLLHAGPNLSYVRGVAESLPFPARSFDKVVSVSCVEHFADPQRGLAEMARVLKPGGRIALSIDTLLPENSAEHFRLWHKRRYFVTQYFSQDSFTGMLQNAGFRCDSSRIVHLFRSRVAALLRAVFIRRPRLWLPLFPAFYLSVRMSDRFFNDHHGQILVVTGSVEKR
jgi:ubiquinone/menaquinone biosynthesis C-methylase UbiE